MFVIEITYIRPLEEIDACLVAHRAYLQSCYDRRQLIVSGPQIPRIGGVLLSPLIDRKQVEAMVENDPFFQNNLATYRLIEFLPVKYDLAFEPFLT